MLVYVYTLYPSSVSIQVSPSTIPTVGTVVCSNVWLITGASVTLVKDTTPLNLILLPTILKGVYPVAPSLMLKLVAFILNSLSALLPSANSHPVIEPSGAVISLLALAAHPSAVINTSSISSIRTV